MARLKFLCDADRCIECNACATVCKNEHDVPWGILRRRVVTLNDGTPDEKSVSVSCMHCMTVSLAQGGYGLGAMWGEEKAHEMIRDAGFKHIEATRLPHDFQNVYYIMTGTVYQDEEASADAETRAA